MDLQVSALLSADRLEEKFLFYLHNSVLFTGRRDYRGGDLRDKLVRRYSPRRRYSPGRDGRGRHVFHDHKAAQHDRGKYHSA